MALKLNVFVKSTRKRKPPQRLIGEYKKAFRKFQRSIGMKGVNAIKDEIKRRDLLNSRKLYNNITFKFTPQGVRYIANTEYASYLEGGVRKHKMKYLLDSKKPIPIDVANNVFRWATKKSMSRGSWVHPGFKRGKGFLSSAIKRIRKDMKKEIKDISMKAFKY